MFDKIPSLKDFIIYLIPGILISYFGLNILHHYLDDKLIITTDRVSNNSALTFVGIIFSFLIGFLFSQFQIIIYNGFLNRYNRKLRTIASTSMPEELRDKVAQQVIKVFDLHTMNKNIVLNDTQILYLCLNYVKINSNDESHFFINRSSYLSTFASVIPLPVLLGTFDLLLVFKISALLRTGILLIVLAFMILFTFKIIINFRREWLSSIYRQFLILSLNKDKVTTKAY